MALDLAHFSATGTVHMQMRITVGNYERGNGQENLWASSLWTADGAAGQVGTIEEGSAGITADVTLARFARWDSGDRLILNAQGNISNLFDQSGDVYRLTLIRETSTGYEIITVGPPSGESADRTFTDWRVSDGTLSQSEWNHLNAISSGDEIILAVHEGTASYSPSTAHAVNGGDAAFAFAMPEPTVTHTQGTASHEVDGGDIGFAFAMPQPTVRHTTSHRVDGGDIAFAFAMPQPTVRRRTSHAVDGGDIAFAFAIPQPAIRRFAAHRVDGGDIAFRFRIPAVVFPLPPPPPPLKPRNYGALGTTFAVSARIPTYYDAGGYAALTFTQAVEITRISQVPARTYELTEATPLEDQAVRKEKGFWDNGAVELEALYDVDDDGMALLDEALLSNNEYAFRITLPEGETYYFAGLVMMATIRAATANDMVMRRVRIEVDHNDPVTVLG